MNWSNEEAEVLASSKLSSDELLSPHRNHGSDTEPNQIAASGMSDLTIKIVLLSDTHSKHGSFRGFEVPEDLQSIRRDSHMLYLRSLLSREKLRKPELVAIHRCAKWGILSDQTRGAKNLIAMNTTSVLEQILNVMCRQTESDGSEASLKQEQRGEDFVFPIALLSGNKKSVVIEEPPIGKHDLRPIIPYGDILIHCGDFTMKGAESEVDSFCQFMAQLPHPYKIVIAGNHDLSLDEAYFASDIGKHKWKHLNSAPKDLPQRLKKKLEEAGVIYLEDERIDIQVADSLCIRFFGSPTQPMHHDWAFQKRLGGEMQEYYESLFGEGEIVGGSRFCDVLITHGPPHGICDLVSRPDGEAPLHLGCPHLLHFSRNMLKPRLHVFGHVHSPITDTVCDDGTTMFVNCALTDHHNNLRNEEGLGKELVKVVGLQVGADARNGSDNNSAVPFQARLLCGDCGPVV